MTGHGGNIYRAAEETGLPESRIIDFSASINPLGFPAHYDKKGKYFIAEADEYSRISAIHPVYLPVMAPIGLYSLCHHEYVPFDELHQYHPPVNASLPPIGDPYCIA